MLSNLGNRIKEERIKRGWSQSELGKRVGCSGVAIMRYEKDSSDESHREPSLERIEAIAKAFGMTPFQLMGPDYFDKKNPDIGMKVKEYESFVDYLKSLGYTVKEVSEKSIIPIQEAPEELRKEYNSDDGNLEVESFSVNVTKGKSVNLTLSESEFEGFRTEIMKAVEFAIYQRMKK